MIYIISLIVLYFFGFIQFLVKEIYGYMILKFFCDDDNIRKGHIIDIQAEDKVTLKSLLKKVENVKKRMNLNLLNMWVFEGSE